jgi:hypothetical protein
VCPQIFSHGVVFTIPALGLGRAGSECSVRVNSSDWSPVYKRSHEVKWFIERDVLEHNDPSNNFETSFSGSYLNNEVFGTPTNMLRRVDRES